MYQICWNDESCSCPMANRLRVPFIQAIRSTNWNRGCSMMSNLAARGLGDHQLCVEPVVVRALDSRRDLPPVERPGRDRRERQPVGILPRCDNPLLRSIGAATTSWSSPSLGFGR